MQIYDANDFLSGKKSTAAAKIFDAELARRDSHKLEMHLSSKTDFFFFSDHTLTPTHIPFIFVHQSKIIIVAKYFKKVHFCIRCIRA